MIKIKSITDVITNSSNETFIIKGQGELYSFDQIRNGYTFGIDRDEWVLLIQEFLHIPLKDNPLPLVNYKGEYTSHGPWRDLSYHGWSHKDSQELWANFVDANREAFMKASEYGYVSGPYDHDMDDYDEWCSENDDLRSESIMSAGRDMGFWDSYDYKIPDAK